MGVGPWVISQLTAPSIFGPTFGPGSGVLGKWDYLPGYDAFIGISDPVAGDVWVYKPTDWQPSFAVAAAAPVASSLLLILIGIPGLLRRKVDSLDSGNKKGRV